MQTCPTAERLSNLLEGDDTDLQALEDHLEVCAGCQETMHALAGGPPDWQRWEHLLHKPAAAALEPSAPILTGLAGVVPTRAGDGLPRVPGYELLEEIGRGGTAVVYRARHLDLQRIVALKIFHSGPYPAPERLARFRAEAEAVARLQHPNVVQVYEVGVAGGAPYLALEYLSGGSLARHIGGSAQPPRAAAALVEVLARAVHFAHEAGIVHRDLKPANILLRRSEVRSQKSEVRSQKSEVRSQKSEASDFWPLTSDLWPMVSDFGLARRLNNDDTPVDSRLTQTGAVLGTPRYMAPEQARPRGGAADAGPAADIWALGAILYELLTGRPPFDAATPMDILLQVLDSEPTQVRSLQPRVPRDLETIALKCLQKNPVRRYASAQELALDLQRFLAGEPIQARPVGAVERVGKWAKRRPAAALALASVLVALVVATGAFLQARAAQHTEAEQRREVAAALVESERSVYFGTVAQARSQWLLNDVRAAGALLDRVNPRQRDWEWAYLRSLNHTDLLTITGTGGPFVAGLAYSPDGRWLAVGVANPFGKQDGAVQVYDSATGALRWQQTGLPCPVWSVAFSPDGRTLASAGGHWLVEGKGELKIWDAASGTLSQEIKAQTDSPARAVAFSPDGKHLATAHLDGSVRVCETFGGGEAYRVRTGSGAHAAAFSPNGRFLITGAEDGVTFWDAAQGKLLARVPETTRSFALSPDGRWLVSPDASGYSARVYDVSAVGPDAPAAPLVDVLAGHTAAILGVAFGPDGQLAATASADGTVRTWGIGRSMRPTVFRGHQGRAAAVAFHPDGRVLASGAHQPGQVKLWDMTRPAEYAVAVNFGPDRADIEALAFAADDRELLVLGLSGQLARWDTASGCTIKDARVPATRTWQTPTVRSTFVDGGRKVVGLCENDRTLIKVWNAADQRLLATLSGHAAPVTHLAADQSGQRLVTSALGAAEGKPVRELYCWDVAAGRAVWSKSETNERTLALAVSADGALLAEARLDTGTPPRGIVQVADLGDGKPRLQLSLPSGAARALTFSDDGKLLAAATDRGALFFWNTASGQALHAQPCEAAPDVAQLAFNPAGTRLAGVNRSAVQLWDVAQGQALLFLSGAAPRSSDNGFNPRVTWSHDGRRLAASNWDRTVTVWDDADLSAEAGKDMLRLQAAARSFAWHLDQLGRPSLAPWAEELHFRHVRNTTPPTADLGRGRGHYYARRRQWDKALADFPTPALRDRPEAVSGLYEHSLLLLQNGKQEEHQRLIAEILAATEGTRSQDVVGTVCPSAILAPLAPADAQRVIALAKRWRTLEPIRVDAVEHIGFGLLRAGQYREAADYFHEAEKGWGVYDGRYRAMAGSALAYLRLGKPEKAQPYLDQVDAWLADQSRRLPAGGAAPVDWSWQPWLAIHLLRREATK